MKWAWAVLVSCSCILLPAAQGQVGVYAAFSASTMNAANTNRYYGPTFGIYYDKVHLPLVNFGMDIRGTFQGSNGNSGEPKVYDGLIGPRAVVRIPLLPLRPYAEGLIGGSHVKVGQGVAYSDANSFSYGFAAGADLSIIPRLDWRVAEYSYTKLSNVDGGLSQNTLTTGIVFRIPFL